MGMYGYVSEHCIIQSNFLFDNVSKVVHCYILILAMFLNMCFQ